MVNEINTLEKVLFQKPPGRSTFSSLCVCMYESKWPQLIPKTCTEKKKKSLTNDLHL